MFDQYIHPIILYFHAHPHMGQFFAFIIALSESLPLIGTVVPGSVTMTAMGTLIGASIIPGFSTLLFASVGAFCGDYIGYWVGDHYKEGIRKIWPFRKYPKWLDLGEQFFHKHGGKSIVFGRFVGPARSTIPLVAGILGLSRLRFIAAAIPSAIMWAILYMVPGILVGALSLELPPGEATKFIIIALILILGLWLVLWAVHKFFWQLARMINRRIDKIWNFLNEHHSSKFFIRFITNQQNPYDHKQLTLALLAIFFALLFLILLASVLLHNALLNWNAPLFHFLQSLRRPWSNQIAVLVTLFGTPNFMIAAGLLIAAALGLKKQWRAAAHLCFIVIATAAAVWIFKHFSHSPRPTGFLLVAKSSSFPSGHTTMTFAVLGFIAFLTAQQLKKEWHWLPYTFAGLLITAVGLSRLYLGAHWLTDIIGSLLLGFSILLITIMHYRRMPKQSAAISLPAKIWLPIVILGLGIPYLASTAALYKKAMHRYTPDWPTYRISSKTWWHHSLHYLPLYRKNRFGTPTQPFNIQWAEKLTSIKQALTQHHWQTIQTPHTLKKEVRRELKRMTKTAPQYHMPIFSLLYRNQPPQLIMIKPIPHQAMIIELRLWKTGVIFTDTNTPLWIGLVNYHLPISPKEKNKNNVKKSKKLRITLDQSGGLNELKSDLTTQKRRSIIIPKDSHPKAIQLLHWDGEILLVRYQ